MMAAVVCLPAAPVSTAQSDLVGTVTAEGLHELVAEHAGEVVVVNFWATWCPPCRTEFPAIIDVHDDLQGRGLAVIAVSMNEADETADIREFLDTFQPPFPVYRAAEVGEAFYQGVTDDWYGEMPVTLIFDPTGVLRHTHKKAMTYDELASDVRTLLPPQ